MARDRYVPALRLRWLTSIYDPLMERWMGTARMREAVIEALALCPGLRVLDLGCGPGRLAIEIKRREPQVTIDAVDGDPAMLESARRNAADAGVEITFREADITDFASPSRYDRIYSTLVFHHLTPAGKSAALASASRMLTPGGSFVVADWSRPRGVIQSALFYGVQLPDGFDNTAPHRDGRFEQALREASGSVESAAVWRTVFGTMELFICRP